MEYIILGLIIAGAVGYLIFSFKKSISSGTCASCTGNCSACNMNTRIKK